MKESPNVDALTRKADEKWSSMLIESVNAGNIRKNQRYLYMCLMVGVFLLMNLIFNVYSFNS